VTGQPDELTRQDVLDLMDACSVASEELRYRQDLPDYEPDDKKQMLAKAERLDDIFYRLCRFPQVELCQCGMGYRQGHYGTPEHESWLMEQERMER